MKSAKPCPLECLHAGGRSVTAPNTLLFDYRVQMSMHVNEHPCVVFSIPEVAGSKHSIASAGEVQMFE